MMLDNRRKKVFSMELLAKELQKSQLTYFRNIFHCEVVLNMENNNGWEGYAINVGSYFLYYPLKSSVNSYFAFH